MAGSAPFYDNIRWGGPQGGRIPTENFPGDFVVNAYTSSQTPSQGTTTIPGGLAVTGASTTSTIVAAKTSTATTGDNIVIKGTATESATGITAGNITGTRGEVDLTGTVTGGAFISGAYGKLVITGTQNHADSRLQAGFFKVDANGGTITAGFLQAIWADMGATGPSGGWGTGVTNIIKATNTTASAVNSHFYGYGKAAVVFDLSSNGGACLDASSTASGSVIGHILVTINGVAGVLRVYNGS